jgi:MFS family permease
MNFGMLQWGRALFGIGAESMYVGQSVVLSKWFLHYELSFAMSISATIPLIASFVGGAAAPNMYAADHDFGKVFGLGFWVCFASLIVVILLAVLDNKTEKHDKKVLKDYI